MQHTLSARLVPGASLTGFGAAFEMKVSVSVAKRLLKGAELPKPGYEKLLARLPEARGHLAMQNIAGTLVLASPSHPTNLWASAFNIDIPVGRRSARL